MHLVDLEKIKPRRLTSRLLSQELANEAGEPLTSGFLIADVKGGTFSALRNNVINAPLQGLGLGETVVASMPWRHGGTPLRTLDFQHARHRGTDECPKSTGRLGGRRILCDHASCPATRMLEACRQMGATPPINAKP